MRFALRLAALALGFAIPSPDALGDDSREAIDFFERKIRPILSERCQSCHGSKVQKGGLRLDSRAAILKGGQSGPAIEPGDAESSLITEAIRREGALAMPPKGPLPPSAVADLTRWIQQGAAWPDSPSPSSASVPSEAWRSHWAFQPIREAPLPAIRDASWPKNNIDVFVLSALETAGLAPSPAADRLTLIRRATFDLIGAPPTPEEIDAFLSDPDDENSAFAKVVDRLLASPHYGERWGRHWLDVARYSDTKGYVFFEDADFPWAYTYRDYVIRSLNEDLPYNVFVAQQIAADRMPLGADRRPLTALGFLTLGGRFMNNAHDIIDDRIDVVTRGFLGLTVSCARCHDHKFDPISTQDYYALYGVFASSIEPAEPPLFEAPPQTKEYEAFDRELKKRLQALEAFVNLKRDALIEQTKARAGDYLIAAHNARDQPATENFMLIADGNDLNPTMIVRWQAYLERSRKAKNDPIWSLWHWLADLPEADFADRAAIAIRERAGPVHPLIRDALIQTQPRSMADVARVYGQTLRSAELIGLERDLRRALDGESASARPEPSPLAGLDELRRVFSNPDAPANLTATPINNLELLPDRPSQGTLQGLLKAVETWRATGPGAPPRAMALEDLPAPREPRVFRRGNPNNLGEPVPRRFLGFLDGDSPQPFRDGSGRLELASAITDPKNPLLARVLVNRVWRHRFGSPLVATMSDFGTRSDPPSHPALLDHLALAFIRDGWSLKTLHRRTMMSASYRQTSLDRPEARRIDPDNVKLWRMNRVRHDFETLRDSILAVSGRWDRKVGGPSVAEIMAPTATRRTLYGRIDRLNLPGLYRTFDFPDPNGTSPNRDENTVPTQALFLMNHPFVIESAKAALKRPEIASAADRTERLNRLHRLIFGRHPNAEERRLAETFLNATPGDDAAWVRLIQGYFLTNEFAVAD